MTQEETTTQRFKVETSNGTLDLEQNDSNIQFAIQFLQSHLTAPVKEPVEETPKKPRKKSNWSPEARTRQAERARARFSKKTPKVKESLDDVQTMEERMKQSDETEDDLFPSEPLQTMDEGDEE